MKLIEIVCNIPICMFEVYMFYDFFRGEFKYRSSDRRVREIVFLGLFLAMMLVNGFGNSLANICIVPFFYVLSSVLLYDGTLKKVVYMNIFFLLIMAGIEAAFEITFSIISGEALIGLYEIPVGRMLIALFEKLINYVALMIIKNHRNAKSFFINRKLYSLVYLLPLVSFLIYAGIAYSELDLGVFSIQKGVLVLGCFLLVPVNIIVFFLLEKLSETMEKARELELNSLKKELMGIHYERVNEINEEHKSYLHDLQHSFKTIGKLAQNGEDQKIIDIIKSMNIEIETIRKKRYCQHPIVNAMLCEADEKAAKSEIPYSAEIDASIDFSYIDDFSLISMLGNLINNAFEAAAKSKNNRFINIEAHLAANDKFIVFCIENGFDVPPTLENGEYLTSKQDKTKHGIGIKNVKERASLYGGFLVLETTAHTFTATLELAVKQEQ